MEAKNITESLPIILINIWRKVHPGLGITHSLPEAFTEGVNHLSDGITINCISLGEEHKIVNKN